MRNAEQPDDVPMLRPMAPPGLSLGAGATLASTLGLVLLAFVYLATVLVLTAALRLSGTQLSTPHALILGALPLAFTFQGFLPGRTLSPTPLLLGVAPWAEESAVAAAEARSSPRNPLLLDPMSQMIPWRRAARDDLLFNPAQGGGAALLGNAQSALLFPSELVSRLLTPFRAVTYSQAARLLIAAFGMFLLASNLDFSPLSALIGATVFVSSGFLQLWRLHPHSLVAAMLPWVLAAGVALWRKPGPRTAVLLALAGTTAFFGGHPETLLHGLLFAAVTVPLLATWRPRVGSASDEDSHRCRKRSAWSAASCALAVLMAAPALLAVVENLRVSAEWELQREARRAQIEVPLQSALERLRPVAALLALGDPLDESFAGPDNLAELGGGALGAGALTLVLVGCVGNRWRHGASLALVGAAGLLFAVHMPLVSAPLAWVPLLRDTLLKRLCLWWVVAGSLLAAAGVDKVRRSQSGWSILAVPGASLLITAIVVLASSETSSVIKRRIWVIEGGGVLLALGVCAAETECLVKRSKTE